MENQQGRGEIPSFKNIVAGEASGSGSQNEARANNKEAPVMGKLWQMKTRGKCLPRENKKPRYVIPNNMLEEYNSYMKDHALICKFVGYWPNERELYRWIYQRWKPKGHI